MYPFNIVLINCNDDLLVALGPELLGVDGRIEAEFLGVESAIETLRGGQSGSEGRNPWGLRQPDAASEYVPMEHARRLFIVHIDDPNDLTGLKRLTGTFAGQPVIAIFDARGNAMLPIAAMRAGATQVVLLPVQPEDFRSALETIALQVGHVGGSDGQIIAIAGVTGGSGATTIAINVAYELAHLQKRRVILAELSLQVGKLPVYLDVEPRFSIHSLLAEIRRLDLYLVQSALTNVADRFSILCGPYDAVNPLPVSAADILHIVEHLRQLSDVVILDVPCTYDSLYFEVLSAADKVVLVAEQKVPSIRSLQMIGNNLRHKQPLLLLNRYDPSVKGFGAERIKEMLRAEHLVTIANDYDAVSAAVNHGKPLRVESPRSKALADIDHLVEVLLPRQVDPAASLPGSGIASVFRGLARAFSGKK